MQDIKAPVDCFCLGLKNIPLTQTNSGSKIAACQCFCLPNQDKDGAGNTITRHQTAPPDTADQQHFQRRHQQNIPTPEQQARGAGKQGMGDNGQVDQQDGNCGCEQRILVLKPAIDDDRFAAVIHGISPSVRWHSDYYNR